MSASYLRNLAGFTGLSCIAIGVYHFALGTASVPGATDANATVDSRERFYSVYFAGMASRGFGPRADLRSGPVTCAYWRASCCSALLDG
jgi:Domain of unknown function (DUF4345)